MCPGAWLAWGALTPALSPRDSPGPGTGLEEEREEQGTDHVGPHFPGAPKRVHPVEEALEILGLCLITCRGDQLAFTPTSHLCPGASRQRPFQGSLTGPWVPNEPCVLGPGAGGPNRTR